MPPDAPAPAFLTVEEMARVVRIGRTTAYQLARRDLANDGSEGLRVVQFGRQLRIPRAALEDLVGGPFEIPSEDTSDPVPVEPLAALESPTALRTSTKSSHRTTSKSTDQPTFPFAS